MTTSKSSKSPYSVLPYRVLPEGWLPVGNLWHSNKTGDYTRFAALGKRIEVPFQKSDWVQVFDAPNFNAFANFLARFMADKVETIETSHPQTVPLYVKAEPLEDFASRPENIRHWRVIDPQSCVVSFTFWFVNATVNVGGTLHRSRKFLENPDENALRRALTLKVRLPLLLCCDRRVAPFRPPSDVMPIMNALADAEAGARNKFDPVTLPSADINFDKRFDAPCWVRRQAEKLQEQ